MTQKIGKTHTKRIWIASDHAGVELKSAIQKQLPDLEWIDLGPITTESVDYPDFATLLALRISQSSLEKARTSTKNEVTDFGILICGSGIGMSISANKLPGIRAALAENPVAARLSREHNNANVLCLGSRFIAPEYGVEIVKTWLDTPFSNDMKHQRRINKIAKLEKEILTSTKTSDSEESS